MTISTSIQRPTAVQSTNLNLTVSTNTLFNDTEDRIWFVLRFDSQNPSARTLTNCTFANGSTTISRAAGFSNVLIGDEVTGAGMPTSPAPKVTNINSNGTQITIDLATTAANTGSGQDLTFDSPNGSASFMVVDVDFNTLGQNLQTAMNVYVLDGRYGVSALTASNIEQAIAHRTVFVPVQGVVVDVDAFLTRIGVPRT